MAIIATLGPIIHKIDTALLFYRHKFNAYFLTHFTTVLQKTKIYHTVGMSWHRNSAAGPFCESPPPPP